MTHSTYKNDLKTPIYGRKENQVQVKDNTDESQLGQDI